MNNAANTVGLKLTVWQTRFAQKLIPGHRPCDMKHLLPSVTLLSLAVMVNNVCLLEGSPRALLCLTTPLRHPPVTVVCGLHDPHMWRFRLETPRFPVPVLLMNLCMDPLELWTVPSRCSMVLPVLLRSGLDSVPILVVIVEHRPVRVELVTCIIEAE